MQVRRDLNQTQLQRWQDQIQDHIINRHVLHANNSGEESIVMIITKNTTPKENDFYDYPTIS